MGQFLPSGALCRKIVIFESFAKTVKWVNFGGFRLSGCLGPKMSMPLFRRGDCLPTTSSISTARHSIVQVHMIVPNSAVVGGVPNCRQGNPCACLTPDTGARAKTTCKQQELEGGGTSPTLTLKLDTPSSSRVTGFRNPVRRADAPATLPDWCGVHTCVFPGIEDSLNCVTSWVGGSFRYFSLF